jgi:protein-histidine pros-kinase
MTLVSALSNYVHEFSQNNGIAVDFDLSRSFAKLSPVAELQLLRIAQEALTNVRRHAMASQVSVRLINSDSAVEMTIKDNGRGFILSDLEQAAPGYHGITIIKERAEGLGGSLTIDTSPGQGTEVKISLPFEKVRL